jgi:endogenous inhibitor of DNA gyrase (YacG/DUF329 family)
MRSYRCAICERTVAYEGRLPLLYPFCSERCRMVDLGRWFRESYSIDRDVGPEASPDSSLRRPSSRDDAEHL